MPSYLPSSHNVPESPRQELVISQNFSGHLVAHTDWPAPLKNKGVYFVKREMEPLPRDNFLNVLTCGDIHPGRNTRQHSYSSPFSGAPKPNRDLPSLHCMIVTLETAVFTVKVSNP